MLDFFNLFKRPIHKNTIESWAKNLDDLAKIGVVGIAALLYSPEKGIHFDNAATAIYLLFLVYTCLSFAKALRDDEQYLSSKEVDNDNS